MFRETYNNFSVLYTWITSHLCSFSFSFSFCECATLYLFTFIWVNGPIFTLQYTPPFLNLMIYRSEYVFDTIKYKSSAFVHNIGERMFLWRWICLSNHTYTNFIMFKLNSSFKNKCQSDDIWVKHEFGL